jgi:hypothetical protein
MSEGEVERMGRTNCRGKMEGGRCKINAKNGEGELKQRMKRWVNGWMRKSVYTSLTDPLFDPLTHLLLISRLFIPSATGIT